MTANCFAFGQTFERLPHYIFIKGVKKSELDKNSKAWIRKWLANEEQRFIVAWVRLVLPGRSCTVWTWVCWAGLEETSKTQNWPEEALPGVLDGWLMSWSREVAVHQWNKLSLLEAALRSAACSPEKLEDTLGGEVHSGVHSSATQDGKFTSLMTVKQY